MTKVLLIGPRPSNKGGVCIWVGHVLDYFNTHDCDVQIKLLDVNRSASLTHLLPKYKRIWFAVKDYGKLLFRFCKELKKEDYSVVHITSSGGIGVIRDWLYLFLSKFWGIRVITHYHCGTLPMLISKGGIMAMLFKYIANNSDIIVLDNSSYESLTNNGFKNIYKIGNPYNSVIDTLKDGIRKPTELLFVGHVVYEKGIRELLQAISNIDGVKLKCFGPENENIKKELNEFIQRNGIVDKVCFYGLKPAQTVYNEMCNSGIFVLPTYTEGFPFVIVEAMACGCPIISTPVGAIEEMLTYQGNIEGYLIPEKNSEALHKQIEYCINNYNEVLHKAEMAKRKAICEYSTNAIMKQLINLWTKNNG